MRPVTILLAGLAAASLLTAPLAAAPKAEKGEPPIVETGTVDGGLKSYSQTFSGADQAVDAIAPSIARAFWVLGGEGTSYPAASLRVRCEILPGGTALAGLCTPLPGTSAEAARVFDLARAAGALPQLRGYRPVELETRRRWLLSRFVEYNLALPAVTAPTVDLTSGELVDHKLVNAPLGRLMSEYPSKALRNEAEAVVTIACQVQSDLSIICRDQSVEPPENTPYFPNTQRRIFGGVSAAPTLADGRDARGKRFTMRLAYRIPR